MCIQQFMHFFCLSIDLEPVIEEKLNITIKVLMHSTISQMIKVWVKKNLIRIKSTPKILAKYV